MLKLAPILEEVPEDARMSSHQGSGSYDCGCIRRCLFHMRVCEIGPAGTTLKPERANTTGEN